MSADEPRRSGEYKDRTSNGAFVFTLRDRRVASVVAVEHTVPKAFTRLIDPSAFTIL